MFARARTAQCRWSTRGVRHRSALAKAAVLRTVSFSFVLTLLRLRRRQCGHDPPPGGARGACAPVRHSQKRLAPMALLDLFSYARARASTARDGALARWSTRSVRPRSALAKTPCADGAARSFFLCLRSCKHGAGLGCLSGGARGACAPYGHSQKQPCCALSLFCPRLSALYAPRYGARISPMEHAERAPPMGTRKNALRRWRCSIFFLMPALVQARRGHKKNARTPSE